jgi:hypothetical protein
MPSRAGTAALVTGDCSEQFGRIMKAELTLGDSVLVSYHDGTVVGGRFMGLSADAGMFHLAQADALSGRASDHTLSGIDVLHYRRLASDSSKYPVGGLCYGAFLGAAVALLATRHEGSSEGMAGVAAFSGGLVWGGLAGLSVGLVLPRFVVPTHTVRCGQAEENERPNQALQQTAPRAPAPSGGE